MAKTDSNDPRAAGPVTNGVEKVTPKSPSTDKLPENPTQTQEQDLGTSVAGEEDPGAALDQTGKDAARRP